MKVTLLGSGDAVGVPAPLCGCHYCEESEQRRRPGLLVESGGSTVVLDVSPDIKEQLFRAECTDVDAFFITHHHFDHVGGIQELAHAAMGFDRHVGIASGQLDPDEFRPEEKPANPTFDVYATQTAMDWIGGSRPDLTETLSFREISAETAVQVGDLRVTPFPVDHARSAFDTQGFAVDDGERRVVYVPDMKQFDGGTAHLGADVLFVEGASLFRAYYHGPGELLRSEIAAADASRTVLVNLNEHLQRMSTRELQTAVEPLGVELGRDFQTFEL